ncbi:MAG: threonylcarbamoyl-AMP synthase [Thaumarchaeota archaeon]|nr:threonylcarbamoyl-AMP synthase [Nitrososphaerota archaeon]MBT5238831.1 threonylcarbamoyl-AMP synthase [Nitrososphaerota archaeon]MBT7823881.1 threonylcarbamoyl-AMP synthase [Nitrososphaerota archaeon]
MFNVNIVNCDKNGINEIVNAYENGQIIVYPTDTVYGIGCDPFNKDSISKIYDLKKREGSKRFPILGFSKEELEKIVEFNIDAEKISEKFWPGQVTLLLPIRKEMAEKINNNGKLAVRVPNNECVLTILEKCKLIIGTSANISGQESILDSNECKTKIPGIDVLVNGGKITSLGESTIIDFIDDQVKVIREGSISKDEIENIL